MSFVLGRARVDRVPGQGDGAQAATLLTAGANGTRVLRIRSFSTTAHSIALYTEVSGVRRVWGKYSSSNLSVQVGAFARPGTSGAEIHLELSNTPFEMPSGTTLKVELTYINVSPTNVDIR